MKSFVCHLCLILPFAASVFADEAPPLTQEEVEQYQKDLATRDDLVSEEVSRTTKIKFFVGQAMHGDMGLQFDDWVDLARLNYEEFTLRGQEKQRFRETVCAVVDGKEVADVNVNDVLDRLDAIEADDTARWERHHAELVKSLSPDGRAALAEALDRSGVGPDGSAVDLNVRAIASVNPKVFVVSAQQRCARGTLPMGPAPKAG